MLAENFCNIRFCIKRIIFGRQKGKRGKFLTEPLWLFLKIYQKFLAYPSIISLSNLRHCCMYKFSAGVIIRQTRTPAHYQSAMFSSIRPKMLRNFWWKIEGLRNFSGVYWIFFNKDWCFRSGKYPSITTQLCQSTVHHFLGWFKYAPKTNLRQPRQKDDSVKIGLWTRALSTHHSKVVQELWCRIGDLPYSLVVNKLFLNRPKLLITKRSSAVDIFSLKETPVEAISGLVISKGTHLISNFEYRKRFQLSTSEVGSEQCFPPEKSSCFICSWINENNLSHKDAPRTVCFHIDLASNIEGPRDLLPRPCVNGKGSLLSRRTSFVGETAETFLFLHRDSVTHFRIPLPFRGWENVALILRTAELEMQQRHRLFFSNSLYC